MKRKALVVGINQYPLELGESRHLTTPDPARDASAIARILEVYGSFEVQRLPTSQDEWEFDPKGPVNVDSLKAAITQLFKPKENNIPDTGLLFFAGIGLRQDGDNGEEAEVFLATSDANPGENIWGISLRWLCQLLEDSPVPQQVIWLDCSHSGKLLKLTDDQASNKTPVKDRCLIAASWETEYAYARNGRGLLSNELLKCLDIQFQLEKVVTNYTLTQSLPEEFKFPEEKKSQHPVVSNTGDPIALTGKQEVPIWSMKTEHVLDSLWKQTKEWFVESDPELWPLVKIHESAKVAEYFGANSKNRDKADKYKEAVQNVLGLTLPPTWWEKEDSVKNLHESLKCLCGAFFCGNTVNGQGRPISIGAAYLIALIAHQKIWGDVTPLTNQITTWEKLPKVTYQLFSYQESAWARSTAKALYDLFYHLFLDRDRLKESQVKKTLLEEPGHKLVIQFNWSARKGADNRSEDDSLARGIYRSVRSLNIAVPESAKNTRSAILRLWSHMLVSEDGFMSPGIVRMVDDRLVVASVTF